MNLILIFESMQLFNFGLLENRTILNKFSWVIFYSFYKFLHKGRNDINKVFVEQVCLCMHYHLLQ